MVIFSTALPHTKHTQPLEGQVVAEEGGGWCPKHSSQIILFVRSVNELWKTFLKRSKRKKKNLCILVFEKCIDSPIAWDLVLEPLKTGLKRDLSCSCILMFSSLLFSSI